MLSAIFNRQTPYRGIDSLLLLFWAVAIDTDQQRRDKEHRRRIQSEKRRFHRLELNRRIHAPALRL